MAEYHITCQNCGKDFIVTNKWYVTKRNQRFCSYGCRNRKNRLNEDYFSQINSDNSHTFGQVISTSHIHDFQTILIRSDRVTLQKIQNKIGSNYEVTNAELGKFQIKIRSIKMVNFLISHGLSKNSYYQEYPPYDILSGLLDTDCYKEVDGQRTFRHHSHKLILEIKHQLGGEIITETYKDVPRGVLGCWWILVW